MQQTKQNKFSTTHIILIVGFLVILAVILVFGYLLISKEQTDENVTYGAATSFSGGTSYVVDESNLAEIEAQAEKDVAEGMFLTTMNMDWSFATSSEPSYNAYVANDPSNTKSVFIEVILSGESEPVFRSTVIPPGSELNEITLAKNLEAGEYAAVCTYYLLNNDTNEIDSSLSLEVSIYVEE